MTHQKSHKLPALQFYPGDWRKDPGIQALTPIQKYIWFEMLLFMHESPQRGRLLLGDKPFPLKNLARAIGVKTKLVTQTVSTLIEFGICLAAEDGVIESKRMMRDEQVRKARKAAGILGGNPNLLNQKSEDSYPNQKNLLNQNPTPSSSISSSISSSNKNRRVKSVFDPTGKTKYLDWVYLSDEEMARVQRYYERNGLDMDDLSEAIRRLDAWFQDNQDMRSKRTSDEKALKGWPMDRAREVRKSKLLLAKAEAPKQSFYPQKGAYGLPTELPEATKILLMQANKGKIT